MVTAKKTIIASSLLVFAFLSGCTTKSASGVEGDSLLGSSPTNGASPQDSGGNVDVRTLPGSAQDFQRNVGDRILFDYDRYDLSPAARDVLDRQASWLATYPLVTIIVEGHCDERGTRDYNIALGARRAASAREYLLSKGVSASRVETISYGKERPTCVESEPACWSQNRRSVSVIKNEPTS